MKSLNFEGLHEFESFALETTWMVPRHKDECESLESYRVSRSVTIRVDDLLYKSGKTECSETVSWLRLR